MDTCTEIQSLREDYIFTTYSENCFPETLQTLAGFSFFSGDFRGNYWDCANVWSFGYCG